jgi:hypothetical protein
MSVNSLNKGQVISVTTLNGETKGIFKDIVVLAQILPALVLEVKTGIDLIPRTKLYPIQNIVSITLPDSAILSPTITETQEANLLKL